MLLTDLSDDCLEYIYSFTNTESLCSLFRTSKLLHFSLLNYFKQIQIKLDSNYEKSDHLIVKKNKNKIVSKYQLIRNCNNKTYHENIAMKISNFCLNHNLYRIFKNENIHYVISPTYILNYKIVDNGATYELKDLNKYKINNIIFYNLKNNFIVTLDKRLYLFDADLTIFSEWNFINAYKNILVYKKIFMNKTDTYYYKIIILWQEDKCYSLCCILSIKKDEMFNIPYYDIIIKEKQNLSSKIWLKSIYKKYKNERRHQT
jgi:hypothetical protein